jgi:catechol 2,3-dioxygenase-like lactoylglutathione lyase family enzyme
VAPFDGINPTGPGNEPSMIPRRTILQALGMAAVGAPLSVFAQGRCIHGYGTAPCDTDPIPEVFAPTGWKTVGLDHFTFHVADYRKEAAFYITLMGWTLRSDDGKEAVVDIGDWASVIFRQAPPGEFADHTGLRGRRPVHAVVKTFCFAIEPWNATTVGSELRKRGLAPVAEDGPGGFQSFHVKDPDGFDLQIGNASGFVKTRRASPAHATLATPAPFASTGWRTVWLDHLSFGVTDYKKSVSFYCNLLGWTPTYDEGSQNECLIGDVGAVIIRGGNPLSHAFRPTSANAGVIDHISFGIRPWDTDGVKRALETRRLQAQVDTSTGDEIHVAAYKSYHTFTPNGYNLQISDVTHDARLELPNAVRPRATR